MALMGSMPFSAPVLPGQGIAQLANLMQQYQGQRIQNQYMPQQFQNQAALAQEQIKNQNILNQYLPAQQQAGINQQVMQTQVMPLNAEAMAMWRSALAAKDYAQSGSTLQKVSPYRDANGNAIMPSNVSNFMQGNGAGGQNFTKFYQDLPYQNITLPNGQNPNVDPYATSPNMSSPQMANSQSAGSQQPQMGTSPLMANPNPSQNPNIAFTENGITGAYKDAKGNIIQPETQANKTYDQKAIAAIQRIQQQLPDLLQLAQFQNGWTSGKENFQEFANKWLGANAELPGKLAAGNQALIQIPEAMLKAYGLNGTTELRDAMQSSLEPRKGESPTQYTNRVYATQYGVENFAKQGGDRLNRGINLNDFNPNKFDQSSVIVSGMPLNDIVDYANENKMTVPQVIEMIKQKQGAANGQ